VIQLTKALALELAFKGIRVNASAPGWILTDINRDYLASERGAPMKRQIPMGRFAEERDLDGPLLLLASDAGRFMTGATIVADTWPGVWPGVGTAITSPVSVIGAPCVNGP
jgi:NAD(P)-dependent dehydrogenase (short-subunit alcohol dehydrogenase family)